MGKLRCTKTGRGNNFSPELKKSGIGKEGPDWKKLLGAAERVKGKKILGGKRDEFKKDRSRRLRGKRDESKTGWVL